MADNHFKIHKGTTHAPQASAPANPTNGDIYYDSTLNRFRGYENGVWVDVTSGTSITLPEKNRIINGGMDYWQRGGASGNTSLGSVAYSSVDRFTTELVGAGFGSIERSSTSLPNNLTRYNAQILTNTPTSDDDDGVELIHKIESINVGDLAGESASFSFFYKASVDAPTEVNVELSVADSLDIFAAVTPFSTNRIVLTNDATWREIKIENFTLPSDAGDGVQIRLTFDNVGTLSTNGFLEVTQFMFAKGATAQPFTYAGGDLASELQLCQRYFEKSYNLDTTIGVADITSASRQTCFVVGTNIAESVRMEFNVNKRTIPVVNTWNQVGSPPLDSIVWLGVVGSGNVLADITNPSERGFNVRPVNGSLTGQVRGDAILVYCNYAADAEL